MGPALHATYSTFHRALRDEHENYRDTVIEEDPHDLCESKEVLHAHTEEMPHAMAFVDVRHMQDDKIGVMAAEMEKADVKTSR